MDTKTECSTAASMNGEEFALLALTDPKEWLALFLEHHDFGTDDVHEYDELGIDDAVHDMYIDCVDSEGGYEGGGDHAEMIFAIKNTKDAVFGHFRVTGYYSSHDGTEWDSTITIVKPREVTVTQYFDIDGSQD